MKKILIMAGGTGGHVFPALAVAEALRQQAVEVHWLGTKRGLEHEVIPREKLPISYISITGLRGKGIKKWLMAPFSLLRAVSQAVKIIHDLNPDVVLGMGGFVSGPGGVAAWLLRKPLVIQEQNAAAGLTNRLLGLFAKQVLQAFPGAFHKRYKAITLGNPLRAKLTELPLPQERWRERKGPMRLLVLGGSQGAIAINKVLPKAIAELNFEICPEIIHQTGKGNLEETRKSYQLLGLKAEVVPFIDDMAFAYSWADLILCRAGASTITELTAVGLGSILIPFPFATDDHQRKNAEFLSKVNAAVLLPQSQLSSAHLAELLNKLMKDRQKLLDMAEKAQSLYQANAADRVAKICIAFISCK